MPEWKGSTAGKLNGLTHAAGTAELARDAMRFVSWQRGTLKCNGMWEPAVDIELTEEERTRLAAMFPPGHQLIVSLLIGDDSYSSMFPTTHVRCPHCRRTSSACARRPS